MRVSKGSPGPLGASCDDAGTNFAIWSAHATSVTLCLFEQVAGAWSEVCIPLQQRTHDIWHAHIEGVQSGQLYGYRVDGPWQPDQGHRFNPAKLIFDPWSRGIGRQLVWDDSLFQQQHSDGQLIRDHLDSAAFAPLSEVVREPFDWGADQSPQIPWERTVIYECHVRGLTAQHPLVPEQLRGTYAGVSSDAMLDHFQRLGVTTLQLMPIHAHVDDCRLVQSGLSNYWGYNTLAWFAAEPRYAVSPRTVDVIREFREMVCRLHQAGIEVILDVVYNHSGEGDEAGPVLSLRGLDNAASYRLSPASAAIYEDFTGCGNTLDLRSPRILQLIMDSLRYWVREMHVDGFRFDLACCLGREQLRMEPGSAFFDAILQDPILSTVKLIAEPWDLGPDGYQVGGFPHPWSELNGKYRDQIRGFWNGHGTRFSELATRLAGSSDLYQAARRMPTSGVNFITSHDGYTLADLVSYEQKHNQANLEQNQDGDNQNHSWNCGCEGVTDDSAILELRFRQRCNLMATLFLSQGVPLLRGGDELGKTQYGNNNPYCHDSVLTWLDWDLSSEQQQFLNVCCRLSGIRSAQPLLQRTEFFTTDASRADSAQDVVWLRPDGLLLNPDDWAGDEMPGMGMLLQRITDVGQAAAGGGDALLVLFNRRLLDVEFQLPKYWGVCGDCQSWKIILDTSDCRSERPPLAVSVRHTVGPLSLVVLVPVSDL